MKFRRLIKRTAEEIGATIRIAKVTSWGEALNTFRAKADIQKMVRNGYRESPAAKKRLLKKHSTMIRYFEITFGDFLSTYQWFPLRKAIHRIKPFGFVGGKGWRMHPTLLRRV